MKKLNIIFFYQHLVFKENFYFKIWLECGSYDEWECYSFVMKILNETRFESKQDFLKNYLFPLFVYISTLEEWRIIMQSR